MHYIWNYFVDIFRTRTIPSFNWVRRTLLHLFVYSAKCVKANVAARMCKQWQSFRRQQHLRILTPPPCNYCIACATHQIHRSHRYGHCKWFSVQFDLLAIFVSWFSVRMSKNIFAKNRYFVSVISSEIRIVLDLIFKLTPTYRLVLIALWWKDLQFNFNFTFSTPKKMEILRVIQKNCLNFVFIDDFKKNRVDLNRLAMSELIIFLLFCTTTVTAAANTTVVVVVVVNVKRFLWVFCLVMV